MCLGSSFKWLVGLAGLLSSRIVCAGDISASDQSRLRAIGFSQADITTFSVTQIAPAYFYFDEWNTCSKQVGELAVLQTQTVSQAEIVVQRSCESKGARLQAVLAHSVGLAKAAKAISVGRAISRMYLVDQFRDHHLDDGYMLDDADLWLVGKPAATTCKATLRFGDYSIHVYYDKAQSKFTVQAILTLKSAGGKSISDSRAKFNGLLQLTLRDSKTMQLPVVFEVANGPKLVVYEFALNASEMSSFAGARSMNVPGVNNSPIFFPDAAGMVARLHMCARL